MRKISCLFLVWALLITAGTHLSAPPADAESYLTDAGVEIARHDRRVSRMPFKRGAEASVQDRWGRAFTDPQLREPPLVNYRELPQCSSPGVLLKEVYRHSLITDHFDVLYYNARDSAQRTRARQYSRRAVAYNPALERDPESGDTDTWQNFARFIRIECLPTRFHFSYIGSQRYMEFRTGSAAWAEQ